MVKVRSFLFNLIKIIVTTCLVVFIINKWFFKSVEVVGSSMYPTLHNHDRGISNILFNNLFSLSRFDVVVVKTENHDHIVKRVIGLPGENIEYRNDKLYINDQEVDEPFLNTEYALNIKSKGVFTNDFGPFQLGSNEYFVMGDNRPNSLDSRFEEIGLIKRENIISKDIYIFFPFSHMNIISKP